MNKDFEKMRRKVEQERQQQQNYQQRPEFIRASGDLAPQSVATKRPPPFVVEKTKGQLQQEAWNQVIRLTTESGYPTFTPRLDTSSMAWKRTKQHQSQTQPEDQFYYDEEYGASR